MQLNKKPWPLRSIYGIKNRINTNPDFQRPPVWGKAQKQLLVDTILHNYDVPKLYWFRTGSKPETYDVVDGQQRLRAIWEFFDGKFHLPKDAETLDDEDIAGLGYQDLSDDLRLQFDNYPLDIIVLQDASREEIREMFLRLQNGTTLKAQERRNAYPGNMRDFVKSLTEHSFFNRVGFSNNRFSHDNVAAQLVCLEMAGDPTNVKNADLNRMYDQNQDFDSKSTQAKSVIRTLGLLAQIFPDKTPELERYNVIALYCVLSELQKQYVIDEVKGKLRDWFIDFEKARMSEEAKPEDQANPEWLSYKEKISHSTDSADSIRSRMEFLMRSLLEQFPTLSRKDNQRSFTHVQKMTIFRRDQGKCKLKLKCDGTKLTWDDWHCDHFVPWSKGGKTTVENGRASCTPCNLAKGNSNGGN